VRCNRRHSSKQLRNRAAENSATGCKAPNLKIAPCEQKLPNPGWRTRHHSCCLRHTPEPLQPLSATDLKPYPCRITYKTVAITTTQPYGHARPYLVRFDESLTHNSTSPMKLRRTVACCASSTFKLCAKADPNKTSCTCSFRPMCWRQTAHLPKSAAPNTAGERVWRWDCKSLEMMSAMMTIHQEKRACVQYACGS
jgi:hypothetical protein